MKKILSFLSFVLIFCNFLNAQVNCVSGNCENGYGKQLMTEGDYYEGEWVNGMRSGKGVYTWADGSVYVGDFKANVFDGVGKYTTATGLIIEGYYANGLFVAPFEQVDIDLAEMERQADSLLDASSGIAYLFGYEDEDEEYDEYDEYEDYEDYEEFEDYGTYTNEVSDLDIDSLMEEIYAMVKNDNNVLTTVINDYPNAFSNIKGAEDFSNIFATQFYSKEILDVAKSTFISLPISFSYWQWVSVICEEEAFAVAEANYKYYLSIMEGLILDCCILTSAETKVIDAYNEQYTTTFTPTAINSGYSSVYNNMKVMVSFYKDYNEKSTYSVVVSVRDGRN